MVSAVQFGGDPQSLLGVPAGGGHDCRALAYRPSTVKGRQEVRNRHGGGNSRRIRHQALSKLVELLQLLRGLILLVAGCEDAHILQMEVVEEGVLVLVDRTAIHMVAAGGEDQCRLLELFRLVQGIDTVDGALELTGEAVIVNGRRQDDHLRLVQQRVDRLHIVLLDALPFMTAALLMAGFTGQAPGDLLLADVHHCDSMAILCCAPLKCLHHGGGVAVRMGLPFSTKICIVQPPKENVTDTSPLPRASAQPVRSSIFPRRV